MSGEYLGKLSGAGAGSPCMYYKLLCVAVIVILGHTYTYTDRHTQSEKHGQILSARVEYQNFQLRFLLKIRHKLHIHFFTRNIYFRKLYFYNFTFIIVIFVASLSYVPLMQ